jgi:hypothetical protein
MELLANAFQAITQSMVLAINAQLTQLGMVQLAAAM